MNKNIIIAILIVVIIGVGAVFVLGQYGKTNTQINIINNETFQNGEHVQFELKDAQGKALSGKTLNITFNNQKYSVTTDQNGKGYLILFDAPSGKQELVVKYAGDDKYNGCEAKETITITDEAADHPASQTDSASTASTGNNKNPTNTNSGLTYNEALGVWVNSDGIIVQVGDGSGEQFGVGQTVDTYLKLMNKTGDLKEEDLPPEYRKYPEYNNYSTQN